MLKNMRFYDTDTRVQRYLVPERIMLCRGDVSGAERLLEYRNRQIRLSEPNAVRMRTVGEEKAGILLDFGTEFHGAASIGVVTIKEAEQARIRLCFGESAGEALSHIGEKGATNDHSARDFEVTMRLCSTETFGATGYRFLYIELLNECILYLKTVQGVAIYQPYEYIGSFFCSDEKLNRIYDTAAYTCHLCLQNELWDGIKRDRVIWIGDLAPELKTIKYVFGEVPELYRGLDIMADEAKLPRWLNHIPTYSLWWLVNLYEWYFYTGNHSYLEAQRDYMIGLTEQVLGYVDENGYFTAGNFIDWPSKGSTAADAGTKGLLWMALNASLNMAKKFGESALAESCESVLARIGKNKESCGGLKQTASLLLLNDLADDDAEKVLSTGGAEGFSTFMSYYILSAMAKCCSEEETLSALRDYYGAMLDLGATTFWEDFDMKWIENSCRVDEICDGTKKDIHGDHGKYCYQGFRHSLCHGWSSGPVPFLTEYVLGVDILEEGCKKIALKPHLGGLSFAKGSIATPYGKVEIEHTRDANGHIQTQVDAPEEIEVIY